LLGFALRSDREGEGVARRGKAGVGLDEEHGNPDAHLGEAIATGRGDPWGEVVSAELAQLVFGNGNGSGNGNGKGNRNGNDRGR
jgi:hypothetical protein